MRLSEIYWPDWVFSSSPISWEDPSSVKKISRRGVPMEKRNIEFIILVKNVMSLCFVWSRFITIIPTSITWDLGAGMSLGDTRELTRKWSRASLSVLVWDIEARKRSAAIFITRQVTSNNCVTRTFSFNKMRKCLRHIYLSSVSVISQYQRSLLWCVYLIISNYLKIDNMRLLGADLEDVTGYSHPDTGDPGSVQPATPDSPLAWGEEACYASVEAPESHPTEQCRPLCHHGETCPWLGPG